MVKRFEEDQELHVYFMLDCSTSMGVGSPTKFDHARRITAALAYIALADLDRVSVTAFSAGPTDEFPAARGRIACCGYSASSTVCPSGPVRQT